MAAIISEDGKEGRGSRNPRVWGSLLAAKKTGSKRSGELREGKEEMSKGSSLYLRDEGSS
jgi:hypothetical protein